MDVCRGRRQRADMHVDDPDFAVAHDNVAFLQLHMPGAYGFDLPTLQHEARFVAVFDEVIVGGFPVLDNAHESIRSEERRVGKECRPRQSRDRTSGWTSDSNVT